MKTKDDYLELMKRIEIVTCALCALILTSCSPLSLINDEATTTDNTSETENSATMEISEESSEEEADSDNSLIGPADDIPWESPMADYVPESPYSSFISFAKGEISTFEDEEFFSDYITGDFKYTCCDLSGDGVPELVLSYTDGEDERLLAFGYDNEAKVLFKALDEKYNSETDRISKNGFVLSYRYKDASGNFFFGKTDDESYLQFISIVLARKNKNSTGNNYITWQRNAGSSEYEEGLNSAFGVDYDCIMEMAED